MRQAARMLVFATAIAVARALLAQAPAELPVQASGQTPPQTSTQSPTRNGLPEQVLQTDAPPSNGGTAPQATTVLQGNGVGQPVGLSNAAGSPEYLLRPGDSVTVSYRFTPEYDDTAVVDPDGHLSLKNLGPVAAGGNTLVEVRARVLQAAYRQLLNPEVTVALKTFEPPQFVVGGQVRSPGSFDLREPTTVLQAIVLAGGPMHPSAMAHVLLFRHRTGTTPETHVLNLKHLDRDHIPDDIPLEPGDMILVRR